MTNYDRNGLSPMKKLIEVLPEAALQVLDQCVTKSHDDNSDPDLQVIHHVINNTYETVTSHTGLRNCRDLSTTTGCLKKSTV